MTFSRGCWGEVALGKLSSGWGAGEPEGQAGQKSGLGFLTVYKGDGSTGEGELDATGTGESAGLERQEGNGKGMCHKFSGLSS